MISTTLPTTSFETEDVGVHLLMSWCDDRCVAAKQLPLGTDVEIECIAVMP